MNDTTDHQVIVKNGQLYELKDRDEAENSTACYVEELGEELPRKNRKQRRAEKAMARKKNKTHH